ncbi:hypothetical protein DFS34DRAFT_619133 [Phlyctochytrium arcticum]|nr:hypothetical protein DFS34DRAFT_619115 [Phlyctochytrium arcticum]KAI9098842.1 hypothetical protein DFS34DRAFT_619133 [Phlyctochytrium arcticum]
MKFVHVSCLNEWRNVSRNKKSYVECDHCRYRYHFRRTTWAKLVVNEAVVTGLTLLLFLCFVILAGFMAKLIIYYFFQPSPDDNNDLLPDTDPSDPHPSDDNLFLLPPQSLSTLLKIDLPHLLSGLLVIGILGFFQLFITFLTGPLGNFPRIRTTHRDGTPNLIIILLIAIGVVRTMWALYKGVRRYCRGRLRFVERGILDVAEES